MVNSALKPFLIAMEFFAIILAFSFLFNLSTKYTSIESQVNKEINNKSDIRISSETYNDKSLIYITGSEVLYEILEQNGTLNIVVDNTPINSLKTVDGEGIFDAIRNGENVSNIIESKLSLKRTYSKEYKIDNKGNIIGIYYKPI